MARDGRKKRGNERLYARSPETLCAFSVEEALKQDAAHRNPAFGEQAAEQAAQGGYLRSAAHPDYLWPLFETAPFAVV